MKRHFLVLVALVLSAQIFVSVPLWAVDPSVTLTSYYANIDGKATNSNDDLRITLCTIISTGYVTIGYSSLPDNVYAASSDPSDFYNGSSKTMEDIYSSKAYVAGDAKSSATTCGTGWNKEHTVPQSWFNEASPMKSDAHHVFPTDIKMNSLRSSYPYGENNAAKECSAYGYGHLGTSTFSGYTGTVFDPGDGGEKGSYKGDLARVYFYMATRYRTTDFTKGTGGTSFTYKNGVADLTDYMKNLMLKWHREDPVSEKELIRNNAIYAHQKNRNPFVDYPCLVEYIWGEHKGESVDLSALVSGYEGVGSDCCSGGGSGEEEEVSQAYYASLNSKSGSSLRSALTVLLYNHHIYYDKYDGASSGTENWDFPFDYDSNGYVWDIYTKGCDMTNTTGSTASCCCSGLNREHLVCQSTFGGSENKDKVPQYADRHSLFLTDAYTNQRRNDQAFGEVDSTQTISKGSCETCNDYALGCLGKVGKYAELYESTENVYEVGDEFKGDVARAVLYMAVRYAERAYCRLPDGAKYNNSTSGVGDVVSSDLTTANNYSVTDWKNAGSSTASTIGQMFSTSLSVNYGLSEYGKAILLKWHRQDKVSQKEIDRNNGVESVQGNRNPFIDYPYLVEYIWGDHAGESVDLTELVGSFESAFVPGVSDGSKNSTATKYTITWSKNGVTSTTQVDEGTRPTPPSVDDCSTTRVFRGWTTNGGYSGNGSDLMTAQTDFPAASSAVTYYAVYADKEGSGSSNEYELYSGSLTEGDYIVYYSGKAMKASVTSSRLGYAEVTPANNKITTTDATIVWHIAQSGSYWTIYNASAKNYAAGNGTKNQAQLLTSGTDDKSLWTASGSATYEFVNKYNTSQKVNANLRGNGTYGFACYSDQTGGALSLYKAGNSTTYSNYGTMCEMCTPEAPEVSFAASEKSATCGGEVTNALNKGGSEGVVTYTSSNTDVASVNASTGEVTIYGAGTTTITANVAAAGCYTAGEASYTLTVNRINAAVEFDAPTTELQEESSIVNEAQTTSDATITYASNNTAVATVNAEGEVTAVAPGTARITASVAQTDCFTAESAYYDLTVTAIPTYTITWSVNGETSSDQVVQGIRPTPPSVLDCSEERVFMGWTTNSSFSGVPSPLYAADKIPNATADATYYAVYADKSQTSVVSKKSYTFNITKDDFNTTSYAANNNEKTATATASDESTMEVKWTSNQIYQTESLMQWQKNKGCLYNSTDLGKITEVAVTSSAGTFTTYYGTAEQPSGSTTVGGGYFKICVGDATGKTSNVAVTFEVSASGSGTETTYLNYSTKCGSKVTVTFHRNYGVEMTKTQSMDVDKSTALTANPWVREHYTFAGWALSAEGAKVYEDGESVSLDEDIDLYALWIEDPQYTVTCYSNGKKVDEVKGYAGEEILVYDPEVCDGYTFVGWSTTTCPTEVTDKPATQVLTTIPDHNVTYYAIFSRQVDGGSSLTNEYQKITTSEELTTANYVIAAYYSNTYGAMSTGWKDTYYLAPVTVTPNAQDIITTTDGTIIWNLTVVGNLVSIYNETAGYLYVEESTKGTSTYYNIKLGDNTTENKFTQSVTDGNWLFTSAVYTDRVIEFYTVDKNNEHKDRWAIYKSADAPVYLYKQVVEDGHTTYYVSSPSCSGAPTAVENAADIFAPRKVLVGDKMYIFIGEHCYDVTGKRIR